MVVTQNDVKRGKRQEASEVKKQTSDINISSHYSQKGGSMVTRGCYSGRNMSRRPVTAVYGFYACGQMMPLSRDKGSRNLYIVCI